MIYEGFKIHSVEHIHEAYCSSHRCRKKKPELIEVSNGFLSRSLFCPVCHAVYVLKLERHTKVPKAFLQQCLDEVEHQNRKQLLIGELVMEKELRQRKKEEAREAKEEERQAKLKARKQKFK